jgi:uncharacterized membrane protein
MEQRAAKAAEYSEGCLSMSAKWIDTGLVRAVLISAIAAAIVHICASFAIPHFGATSAYERLAPRLPVNVMVLLPPPIPNAQLLPYQAPDTHYAMCRFDASEAPVELKASLPERGWMFALYSPAGDNFYAIPGHDQRRTEINAVLVPQGDSWMGNWTVASLGDRTLTEIQSPSPRGLLVIQAPIKGQAYRREIERELARASCSALRPRPS